MPKASPILLSFSSGELSRLFDGRVDLEEYPSGCRILENFIPLLQGPAARRGGTTFMREVKDSTDRTGLMRFEFNTEQAYQLEVGDQYIRFYTDHGIVLNGTNPLEVATPWVAADLFDTDGNFKLRFVQSGDVMYITHIDGDYQPRKLTRSGALSWAMAAFEPEGGPFEDIDPDETVTVYSSAATGNVTLTASSAIFEAGHVGGLFLLEQKNADDTLAWESGKTVTVGDVRRVENRSYQAVTGGTTGTVAPAHTVGDAYDGNAGVQWRFLDSGYGWGKITAVGSSGTTATMTVQSRLPLGTVGSGDATTRWAFGKWSTANGFPTHVTFFRERLTFAQASTRELEMSVAGDFENFRDRDLAGDVVADSAISIEVTSDQVNKIEWLAPADSLLVGTAGGEFAVGEITTSEPLGPGNVKASPQSAYGSKPVRPELVGDSVLFVQRSGRKLRDFFFSLESGEQGKYKSTNLSILAPHLLPKGKSIIALAYQQEPHSVIWALRSDGKLLATTINANQKRFGWHRHPIGGNGVVEAIEVTPNPDGDADELTMIVKRTIDGSTVRYVEYMVPEWDSNDDIYDAFYVDSGLTFNGQKNATLTPGTGATVAGTEDVTFTAGSSTFVSGDIGKQIRYRYTTTGTDDEGEEYTIYHTACAEITAVSSSTVAKGTILSAWPSLSAIAANGWAITATSITGLDHLEGATVDVLADGATHPQETVTSGAITLDRASAVVHVGLPCPCKLKTMRIEAGAADGTAQGKTKRIHKAVVRLVDTVGGFAGPNTTKQDEILFRDATMAMDEPVPAFTGDKEVSWPDSYTKDAYLQYYSSDPLPVTVVAFMPQVVTQDR
jgi:hypothetical protein